jgi:hypothetical protein
MMISWFNTYIPPSAVVVFLSAPENYNRLNWTYAKYYLKLIHWNEVFMHGQYIFFVCNKPLLLRVISTPDGPSLRPLLNT